MRLAPNSAVTAARKSRTTLATMKKRRSLGQGRPPTRTKRARSPDDSDDSRRSNPLRPPGRGKEDKSGKHKGDDKRKRGKASSPKKERQSKAARKRVLPDPKEAKKEHGSSKKVVGGSKKADKKKASKKDKESTGETSYESSSDES
jgi:hypothetical protein